MRPILILSQDSGETTTDAVMEHLIQMGLSPFRLNGSDFDSHGDFSIRINGIQVEVEAPALCCQPRQIQAVWFRRWSERQPFQEINLLSAESVDSHTFSQRAAMHLLGELRRVNSFLFSEFGGAEWLSHPSTANPNKLEVLKLAAHAGLKTPATIVTTSKEHLLRFASCYPVITKPIGDVEVFQLGKTAYLMYTRELSAELLDSVPNHFFPTLFQEKIEKEYELRVFYLADVCYASAIFSQQDKQTANDFRRYNNKRPNRIVPYKLPVNIEKSIQRLMGELLLETGSLDLIKTPDGDIIFLEVNPVGQFGMVSTPCNYHLEREVAEVLARKGR